jgi:GNAT superfamily N-acetyltransferase
MKLNAAYRLLSQTIHREEAIDRPTFRSSAWNMLESKSKSFGIKDGLEMRVGKLDSGGSFVYLQNLKAEDLKDQSSIIGGLELTSYKTVASVYLDPSYRRKGLGTVLYLGAIRAFTEVRSGSSISIYAVRTWRSVSKYHKVDLLESRTGKSVPYIWGPDGIPSVDGKPIDELSQNFQFRATSRK